MIEAQRTLESLGYLGSPNFLRTGSEELRYATDYGHIFRKAEQQDGCRLQGVYALRQPSSAHAKPIVPLVYVCSADTEQEADKIHRLVWNQNVVPFLIVETRFNVRFYSGFRHQPRRSRSPDKGILRAAIAFNEMSSALASLRAEAIDDGTIWSKWGKAVTPQTRVDWQLVANLKELDEQLRANGLDMDSAHALIGKYVYLHYLRDRGILEPLLDEWGVDSATVFGRNAEPDGFWALTERLDNWPNGAVFPVSEASRAQIKKRHVAKVAGVFSGDEPSGQLSLDFEAYDFAHIPIETLSVVYQNFLHTPKQEGERTRGKESGAYYTPIPLVNLMLDEVDAQHPLRDGMKVLDPSCGSGAFLVQCYRRLVEQHLKALRQAKGADARPTLTKLRDLLVNHIFGVERDDDACRVARLSLTLALLDYVDPPQLVQDRNFKLPDLSEKSIFKADFFEPNTEWDGFAQRNKFDWIVGNPPWIVVDGEDPAPEDEHVWRWMKEHKEDCPVGNNQVAEAFAWKVIRHLKPEGAVGLLMPAMTLFNDSSKKMRIQFFSETHAWCVANLANLRHVLFGGRAVGPAAAVFYRLSRPEDTPNDRIAVFAPFLANQGWTTGRRRGAGREAWSIVVNAAEVRSVSQPDAVTGDMLPWKAAMWGTRRDRLLLERIASQFESFSRLEQTHKLKISQGLPLRTVETDEKEKVKFERDLVGKRQVDFKQLREAGRIFVFPPEAIKPIPESESYLRDRSGREGLAVFHPPHIVVDRAWRFAVFSDEYLVIPAPHIGIAGSSDHAALIRSLSLYLSSDLAAYHQFMTSPEWGVRSPRGTSRSLRTLPMPLAGLPQKDIEEWADMHRDIVVSAQLDEARLDGLLRDMNRRVFDLAGLRPHERDIVSDLIQVRMEIVDGKIGEKATRPPETEEATAYLRELRNNLDQFIEEQKGSRHKVEAWHDEPGALICIELVKDAGRALPVAFHKAHGGLQREIARIPEHLRQQHSQWVYFERNLRIYDGPRVYLFKPMQRVHWTKTQAYVEAGEIIADVLTGAEG